METAGAVAARALRRALCAGSALGDGMATGRAERWGKEWVGGAETH